MAGGWGGRAGRPHKFKSFGHRGKELFQPHPATQAMQPTVKETRAPQYDSLTCPFFLNHSRSRLSQSAFLSRSTNERLEPRPLPYLPVALRLKVRHPDPPPPQ